MDDDDGAVPIPLSNIVVVVRCCYRRVIGKPKYSVHLSENVNRTIYPDVIVRFLCEIAVEIVSSRIYSIASASTNTHEHQQAAQ